MAVKASVTITLSVYRDTDSVTRYYLLQSSTLSKPSKPTAYPPAGDWDDTEPGYTSGSTNSLYFVDCTVFSDGTFQYSDVSLSSSYEAAKEAYNLAVAASDAVDNLSVGGRNYLTGTRNFDSGTWWKSSNVTLAEDDEGYTVATFAAVDTLAWNQVYSRYNPLQFSTFRGKDVVLSFDIRSDDYEALNALTDQGLAIVFALCAADSVDRTRVRTCRLYETELPDEWTRLTYAATLTDDFFTGGSGTIDDTTRFYIQIFDYSLYSMQIRKVKLEIGIVPTDWTPAPEDTETAIEDVVTIVNGKTTSYYADTVPSGTDYTTGDIWFDTANDNAMYYWNGSAWTPAPLGTDAIADGAITADLIAASAVTAGKISSGAVTTDKLAANAVTAAKIAANTITSTQIAAGTITGDNIATGTITAGNLVAGTITSNEIAAGTITASNIASGTITAKLIATGTITGDNIAAETITGDNLVASTITATQIAASTITGDKIAANTIEANKLNVTELSTITANLGAITGGSLNIGNGTFIVDAKGNLTATSGSFSGKITSSEGTLGGFTITSNAIYCGTKPDFMTEGNGNVYLGTDGLVIGNGFYVDADGLLVSTDAKFEGSIWLYDSTADSYLQTLYALSGIVTYVPPASFNGAVTMEKTLNVDGRATFNGILDMTSKGIICAYNYGIYHYTNDGDYMKFEYLGDDNDVAESNVFILGRTSNLTYLRGKTIKLVGDMDPYASNTYDLGGESYYYRRIYVGTVYRTSESSLSDFKLKQNITPLDDRYTNFIMGLEPISYDFVNGDTHRKHLGFGAQPVRDAAYKTVGDLALFKAQVNGDDNATYEPGKYTDDEVTWGLSYDEFIAPMVKMLQDLRREMDDVKRQLTEVRNGKHDL